jgi:hypothetical protein
VTALLVFDAAIYFKVDDVDEASSKPPVRIVEDNVTASLHRQRMP